jgi:DNA repair exonuclease SbcCD ATPase subunit
VKPQLLISASILLTGKVSSCFIILEQILEDGMPCIAVEDLRSALTGTRERLRALEEQLMATERRRTAAASREAEELRQAQKMEMALDEAECPPTCWGDIGTLSQAAGARHRHCDGRGHRVPLL